MVDGKRIHRINISVDDEMLCVLTHLANYERRVLADYIHRILQEHLFGHRIRLPRGDGDTNSKDCYSE